MADGGLRRVRRDERLFRAVRGIQTRLQGEIGNIERRVKGAIDVVRTHVVRVVAATGEKVQGSAMVGLPLASVAAGDASHPNLTAKFAPTLNKKEKNKLRGEVAARLKGIKVFTVANASNEFVLVSSEHASEKQIGLLFFNPKDANALLEKVKTGESGLKGDVKVMEVGLDKVYQFASDAMKTTGPLVAFRFLPDRREVYNAIKIHQGSGHATERLVGVPVFQAEGLTINTKEGNKVKKLTPLFLTRKDLDVAVDVAFKENASRARIEVGVFEDVLTRMESPGFRQWQNVIFVPPGASESMFGGAK